MATPTPDTIETFMRITGSSEFVAVQKLEEYGGNLNEAVNAHFIEGDRHIVRQNFSAGPQYGMDVNNQNHVGSHGLLPLLSAARRFRPSLLLDPNYRRELRDMYNRIGATAFTGHMPYASHQGEVREVPVEMNTMYEQPHHSGLISTSVDMSGNSLSHGRGTYGIDDFRSDFNLTLPNTSHIPNNATEEEMIQAAIEASRLESRESASGRQFGAFNDSSEGRLSLISSHQEDEDLARAISLSLKMAEQEKAMHKHVANVENEELGVPNLLSKRENADNSIWKPGTSSNRGTAQNLTQSVIGAPLNHNVGSHLQGNEDVLISTEWGNMSSEELNEAVLLETALFSDMSNPTSHNLSSFPGLEHCPERTVEREVQCLPTPTTQSLTETQLLIKQQDVDYLASLLADKQKELNALKEVETRCLKEKEPCNLVERKEWEKMLNKKEIFLPKEPPLDDENAITIVVRMPDGRRRGRRFLKTDKLKFIFDFIDVDGELKTGSYRVVKSYPRHAYSIDDSSLTLSEVGLTNRHEALFLELI